MKTENPLIAGAGSTTRTATTIVALLIAAGALLAIELGLRFSAVQLSGDVRQIREHEVTARKVATSSRPVAVLIGNSLLENGVDLATLVSTQAKTEFANTFRMTTDASSLWDWRCLAERWLPARRDQNELILAFAWDQLTDDHTVVPQRTFGLVCEWSEAFNPALPAVFDAETRLAGLAAYSFNSFALQTKARHRLLEIVVPHYRDVSQRLNSQTRSIGETSHREKTTYNSLLTTASTLAQKGYRLTLLAMPVQAPYKIDAALCDLAQQGHFRLIDGRNIVRLGAADYRDDIHLNSSGSAKFTAALMDIWQVWPPNAPLACRKSSV